MRTTSKKSCTWKRRYNDSALGGIWYSILVLSAGDLSVFAWSFHLMPTKRGLSEE